MSSNSRILPQHATRPVYQNGKYVKIVTGTEDGFQQFRPGSKDIAELEQAVNNRQLSGSSLGIRRKLLSSLIEQINQMLREIQEHLQRNHTLLKDSLAPMQHILDRIVWN